MVARPKKPVYARFEHAPGTLLSLTANQVEDHIDIMSDRFKRRCVVINHFVCAQAFHILDILSVRGGGKGA